MFPVRLDASSEPWSTETWVRKNQSRIKKNLTEVGAVLIEGLALKTTVDFDRFVAAYGSPSFSYNESLSNAVRINFTDRIFTANEAPSEVEIYLHHEMAQTPVSPSVLFFCCISAAIRGGATPLCRSDKLFSAFKAAHPKWTNQLTDKGLRYITKMPAVSDGSSGQGRSWYSTLAVNSKLEAEHRLLSMGYTFKWQDDASLKALSPLLPAVVDLEFGRRSFYHQLIAAFRGWPGVQENPASGVMFGDRTEISLDLLDTMSALAQEYTTELNWADGQVAVINNKMVMHGRKPYSGEKKRLMLVSMAP